MVDLDLSARPRLADLRRLGGPAGEDLELRTLTESAESGLEPARRPRRTPVGAFADRTGYYREEFLDFSVPLPEPVDARAREVLAIPAARDNRLDYAHFSVVISRSRRIALFTAVNIGGKNAVSIERGADHWALDACIPDEAPSCASWAT